MFSLFFASHYSREFFRRLFKKNQDCLQIVYKEALYRFPPLNKELGALFFYPIAIFIFHSVRNKPFFVALSFKNPNS